MESCSFLQLVFIPGGPFGVPDYLFPFEPCLFGAVSPRLGLSISADQNNADRGGG